MGVLATRTWQLRRTFATLVREYGPGLVGFTVTSQLRSSAQAFGEGIQLVTILKDADEDARCGRLFVPAEVERSTISTRSTRRKACTLVH